MEGDYDEIEADDQGDVKVDFKNEIPDAPLVPPAKHVSRIASALNRSVIGSMNDLIGHAVGWLEYGDISPHDLGFRLNDILLSARAASKSEGYGKPTKTFKRLAKA